MQHEKTSMGEYRYYFSGTTPCMFEDMWLIPAGVKSQRPFIENIHAHSLQIQTETKQDREDHLGNTGHSLN